MDGNILICINASLTTFGPRFGENEMTHITFLLQKKTHLLSFLFVSPRFLLLCARILV